MEISACVFDVRGNRCRRCAHAQQVPKRCGSINICLSDACQRGRRLRVRTRQTDIQSRALAGITAPLAEIKDARPKFRRFPQDAEPRRRRPKVGVRDLHIANELQPILDEPGCDRIDVQLHRLHALLMLP
jgi:hypothetical protein